MNKYLMLSAAAALATTGANAGTAQHSFQFATASGTSYCDGGTYYTSGSTVWSWQHTNNNCASGVSFGQGLDGKAGGWKGANMSDTILGQNYGIFSEYISFALPAKFTGKKAKWELFIGLDGTTSFVGNSGKLINVDGPKGKVASHKGTTSNLKQLIALHKQK